MAKGIANEACAAFIVARVKQRLGERDLALLGLRLARGKKSLNGLLVEVFQIKSFLSPAPNAGGGRPGRIVLQKLCKTAIADLAGGRPDRDPLRQRLRRWIGQTPRRGIAGGQITFDIGGDRNADRRQIWARSWGRLERGSGWRRLNRQGNRRLNRPGQLWGRPGNGGLDNRRRRGARRWDDWQADCADLSVGAFVAGVGTDANPLQAPKDGTSATLIKATIRSVPATTKPDSIRRFPPPAEPVVWRLSLGNCEGL